jgi:hypothetical protein
MRELVFRVVESDQTHVRVDAVGLEVSGDRSRRRADHEYGNEKR